MEFLLDTNACIAIINGKPSSVRATLAREIAAGSRVFVSSIASFELWYGFAKSARIEQNRQRLEAFFLGPFSVLPFDDEDARRAGEVRGVLEKAGEPIGAYDLLIAGQALRHGLTLVTANTAEFARVKGLARKNWTKV